MARYRGVSAALLLAACLTAAGCGSGSSAPTANGAGSTTPSTTPSVTASASPTTATGRQVALHWTLVSMPPPGSRTIAVRFTVGGCVEFERLDVAQTPAMVTIAVVGVDTRKPGSVCPNDRILVVKTADLQRPLGHRRLTHGVTGPSG